MRRRGGSKRALGTRSPMAIPQAANQRWSLDFLSDAMTDGRRFRILAMVDDFTRECLALVADTSLPALRVGARTRCPRHSSRSTHHARLGQRHRVDSMAILRWSQDQQIEWHYIAPGKPQQNAFVESFNGGYWNRNLRDLFGQWDHTGSAMKRAGSGVHRQLEVLRCQYEAITPTKLRVQVIGRLNPENIVSIVLALVAEPVGHHLSSTRATACIARRNPLFRARAEIAAISPCSLGLQAGRR